MLRTSFSTGVPFSKGVDDRKMGPNPTPGTAGPYDVTPLFINNKSPQVLPSGFPNFYQVYGLVVQLTKYRLNDLLFRRSWDSKHT